MIYIDWDDTENVFTVNPLIWGKWGEDICSNIAAIMGGTPISAQFRSDGYSGSLTDFLVRTMCNNVEDSRLFVLEQPDETFNSFDYRYVTPDSIDVDSTYPRDAFYVHRFYLETGGGDFELYFSHTDSEFSNVTTASVNGNIFDYDNDGLYDLFATVEYYDDDSLFIMQHCGTSVRVYHRLPAIGDRKYRFEQAFRKDLAGLTLGRPVAANLNGDASDGKEGWVIPANIDTSMTNDLNTAPGIVSVYKEGEDWKILGTCPDSTSLNKYIGVYSGVSVFDDDGDGYDDAVIKLDKESMVVPYSPTEKFMVGDLKLFRNMRNEIRDYEELFTHNPECSKVLWENDALTWDVHMEDFDDDGEQELGCSLARREPAWGNLPGNYGIYYSKLKWTPTNINTMDGKSPFFEQIHLFQNYQNPFSTTTFIHFNLKSDDYVSLNLYNLRGDNIRNIQFGYLHEGIHKIAFCGDELVSGIYFYKLETKVNLKYGKMILIK